MQHEIKVISFSEFRNMKVSTLDPRPLVVFINRREAFKPNKELIAKTEDLMRRKKSDRMIDPFRRGGYDADYRYTIGKRGKALGQLREIATESRSRPVLFVKDNEYPDADILLSMIKVMMNNGVW